MRAIFDFRDKPAIGEPPAYISADVELLAGLTKVDSLVLKLAGAEALKKGTGVVHDEPSLEHTREYDLSDEAALESLEALQRDWYLKIRYVHNTSRLFHSVTMTAAGLEEYASNYVAGYSGLVKAVAHQIVNFKEVDSTAIAAALNQPILLINHIVESFENRRLYKTRKSHTGDFNRYIYQISPLLKRELD